MRKILTYISIFTLAIATSFSTSAQKKKKDQEQIEAPTFKTDDEGNVVYTAVVEHSGTPKQLYDRCVNWFGEFYPNPTGVVEGKKEGEEISGTARFNIYIDDAKTGVKNNAGIIQYNIVVMFKDGRYKYTIDHIHKKASSYFGIERWIEDNQKEYSYAYATYLTQIDEYFKALIGNMKEGMKPVEKKSDDW